MKKMNIGFEVEFLSDRSSDNVRSSLSDVMGIEWGYYNDEFTDWNDGLWRICWDGSIYNNNSFDHGHEVCIPPMPIARGLETLRKMFMWMEIIGATTNHSTGLHFSMSFASRTHEKRLDLLKLLMLVPEKEILKQFNRSSNMYCRSNSRVIERSTKEAVRRGFHKNWLVNSVRQSVVDKAEKYQAINIGKWADYGYVEFRMIGGKDYHKRFDEISDIIMDCAKAMDMATEPDAAPRTVSRRLNAIGKPKPKLAVA